jgi:hypothetical protein
VTGIVKTTGRLESVRVLRHRLSGDRPVYRVGAHGGATRVGARPPPGPGCALTLSYTPIATTN